MAIIGETPNIAARLQGLAEPDTLVISADTYERIEGFFDCRPLGEHSLKGISRPIAVYQALAESTATIDMARASNHPPTLVYALYFTAKVYHCCWEEKMVRALTEECQSLSAAHDNYFFQAAASVLHGWTLVEEGKLAAGTAQLRQNISAFQATGAELVVPYWLTLLADAYAKEGLFDEGLAAVDQALAIAEKGGEHMWDAEIYRIRGKLLLEKADTSEAEQCFKKALDIARRQEAKSWELRAATSLSRLWRGQDRAAEARELLAGVYGWFAEGFGTHDLIEAKMLLDELSPEVIFPITNH